ncbi:sel1 repeat family protein [Larsenimonas salina]|nr:sel1 repeat family protein [Larsenimonas salina]MCM5705548.1 sel1 repeat family protein [Larsenimonas salina]
MLQAATLFARMEYRIAERLLHANRGRPSPRCHRLSMRLFKRCANAGLVDAQSLYGLMLFRCGVTAQEKAKGAHMVLQAAEAGDVQAQFQAGRIFEFGCNQYVARESRAVTWYARAAEAGYAPAADRLARAYRNGQLGLQVNDVRADYWDDLGQPSSEASHVESLSGVEHVH